MKCSQNATLSVRISCTLVKLLKSERYFASMEVIRTVIGVDVGGTNTDAVIIDRTADKPVILAQAKTRTTSDVTTGVRAAIHLALLDSKKRNRILSVQQINIGTTHFINTLVEGKHLTKVAVIRLCGTASRRLPPFCDFPDNLVDSIKSSVFLLNGGYQFDGKEITPIDEKEVQDSVDILKSNGVKNIVVSGIYSPLRNEQELQVMELIHKYFSEASVTLSHEIGKIGLLERENAAILNECIKPLCIKKFKEFRSALDALGLQCPMYLTRNDGTILQEEEMLRFPIFSFSSGATNSIRGAAFLTGLKEAIVVDIGGTSTDVGVLLKGFAREASVEKKVGGIRTNFQMPDVISIGLGGGSYIKHSKVRGQGRIEVGPQSAGYCIKKEAFVFAQPGDMNGRVLTATDIAVASGIANVGMISNVKHLNKENVKGTVNKIHSMISACIDQMRFNDRDLQLVLVGGGSVIVDRSWKFDGVSEIIRPEYFDVANAIGAALSQISTVKDQVVNLDKYINKLKMKEKIDADLKETADTSEEGKLKITENVMKEFLQEAREKAMDEILKEAKIETVESGANPDTISLVMKDIVTLTYILGNASRIKMKVVGDFKIDSYSNNFIVPETVYHQEPQTGMQTKKQTVTNTGVLLSENSDAIRIETPNVDENTGEWLLSEYDTDCIHIGAGILGCGGGGSPYLGRLLAISTLRAGKKIRVITPSRFFQNVHPQNDLVSIVAFMGAPVTLYEKLIAGNETVDALECMQDLFRVGGFKDGKLTNKDGVDIKTKDGVTYIDDYRVNAREKSDESTNMGDKKIVALMSAETGGMNSIVPLVVGAALDLPILDCDGMGRAFPELQMMTPFIYGNDPYPATLADDKGRRAVVLRADCTKSLENHFRDVVISMGCTGGVVMSYFDKDQVLSSTVQYSTSHAWRIGDTVLRARAEKRSTVDAVVKSENGKLLVYGKITDVVRETTGGFNKGNLILQGLGEYSGKTVIVEFRNEFLVAREGDVVLACVPDLITLMDADTAQPIPTEELRFGIRVAVVAMRASPMISSEQALRFVSPQAFGYGDDVQYTPLCDFVDAGSVGPK
ncbi:uncharacterized protein LOC123549023 [Mercenaria mercenaria]|uniref:uncharacterized protein LOC123549023 n=1 Tax=Mercenaria mercenaria TaxID=6596 RepID=UPI00234E993A|nr:uncharacterized protein LOC123549023 [Mercenaria mercenaria]